ncbi:uncharacterized protein LOC119176811 isoform X3 [Rhipicephalus microplus]|uniref:uncharacterized protein LOC119176811 isoform X3 n=1 Tax=Rhipicephalus microplus TaxID=6941 RepID=UPI003F6BE8EC
MSARVLSALSKCKPTSFTGCLVRKVRVSNRHHSLVLSNRLCSSNFSGSAASHDGMSGGSRGAADEWSPTSLEESYRRCFVGNDLSAKYKLARPIVPPAMVADIVEYANETVSCKDGLCVDVGCGPGQSTELFCPHFRKVVGTDISETQIEIARAACTAKNVSFELWCLYERRETCRTFPPHRTPDIFRYQEFEGYLTAQHDFWTYGYEKTEVPFSDVRKKDYVVNEMTTLSAVLACVRTWSFVIRMEEKEPERAKQALERLETRNSQRAPQMFLSPSPNEAAPKDRILGVVSDIPSFFV